MGSEVLMPVRALERPLVLWGDGIHDDTRALRRCSTDCECCPADALVKPRVYRAGWVPDPKEGG
jgi:hypothetical protein